MKAIRSGASEKLRRALVGQLLAAFMRERNDNILLLRLVAALLVVWGHSYVVVGRGIEELEPIHELVGRTYANILGVVVFFVLSGFLVTASWDRRPDLGRFLRARALRIFPALFVCVVLTAFAIGAAVSNEPNYWSLPAVYRYVLGGASLLDVQFLLPGVFDRLPGTPVVNGSLWTLPVEASLYLVVAVAGIAGFFRHRFIATLGIIAAAISAVIWPFLTGAHTWLGWQMVGFFGLGACAYLQRDRVPLSGAVLITLVLAWYMSRGTQLEVPFFWIAVPYGAFWFAYVPRIPNVLCDNDWSYGMYLWAFPIQQLIVAAGIRDPIKLFVLTLPLTIGAAVLSWRFVERPALTLKNCAGGRHNAYESEADQHQPGISADPRRSPCASLRPANGPSNAAAIASRGSRSSCQDQ